MAVVIGLMILGFASAGALLLFIFTRELARRLARRPYLERAEGTVTGVVCKPMTMSSDSGGATTMHFPVITFDQQGEARTFTSEVGDGNATRYAVGQRVGVLYDPMGEIPPAIDSWSGLWLAPVMGIVAGVGFVGGAALVYAVFGERAFGR